MEINFCRNIRLNLENNAIGDEGAAALAEALKVNTAKNFKHPFENPLK